MDTRVRLGGTNRERNVTFPKTILSIAAVLATLSALPATAQTTTPKVGSGFGPSATTDADTPNASPLKRGSTVNNTANANQHAPGDAKELARDTKQSATGGPSGGFGRGGAAGGS